MFKNRLWYAAAALVLAAGCMVRQVHPKRPVGPLTLEQEIHKYFLPPSEEKDKKHNEKLPFPQPVLNSIERKVIDQYTTPSRLAGLFFMARSDEERITHYQHEYTVQCQDGVTLQFDTDFKGNLRNIRVDYGNGITERFEQGPKEGIRYCLVGKEHDSMYRILDSEFCYEFMGYNEQLNLQIWSPVVRKRGEQLRHACRILKRNYEQIKKKRKSGSLSKDGP